MSVDAAVTRHRPDEEGRARLEGFIAGTEER